MAISANRLISAEQLNNIAYFCKIFCYYDGGISVDQDQIINPIDKYVMIMRL